MNTKSKAPEVIEYIDLSVLSNLSLSKPREVLEPKEAIKEFYRNEVRENTTKSQLYYIYFLVSKLEKHYEKKGIFRLFWYNQNLIYAFYQSLLILEFNNEKKCLKKS